MAAIIEKPPPQVRRFFYYQHNLIKQIPYTKLHLPAGAADQAGSVAGNNRAGIIPERFGIGRLCSRAGKGK